MNNMDMVMRMYTRRPKSDRAFKERGGIGGSIHRDWNNGVTMHNVHRPSLQVKRRGCQDTPHGAEGNAHTWSSLWCHAA